MAADRGGTFGGVYDGDRGSAAPETLGDNDVQAIDQLREVYARLRKELGRVIVGQHDVDRAAVDLPVRPRPRAC